MPRSKAAKATKESTVGPSGESLEQVRDLLFGAQMRTVDDRLAQMEKRFQSSLADLGKQLASLEKAATKRSDDLDEKVKAERARRSEELRDLRKDMRAGLKDLDTAITKLEESTSKSDAELRDQLLQAVEGLSRKLDELSETLGAELGATADRLETDKADRLTLAELFAGFAERLGNGSEAAKG